jgi:lipoprotein NlpD
MRYQPGRTGSHQALCLFGIGLGMTAQCRGWRLLPLLAVSALILGCSSLGPAPVESRDGFGPVPPGYHRVLPGETLYRISSRRGLDYHEVARWNGIKPPYHLYAGSLVRIVPPGTQRRTKREPPRQEPTPRPAETRLAQEPPTQSLPSARTKPPQAAKKHAKVAAKDGLRWSWPLRGRVLQTFRPGDRTHEGIRISGKAGEMVLAAEGGKVVYSGSGLKGYGNLIIVKHNDKYLSAYGFNRRLLVKEGEHVSRGEPIAEVGQLPGGGYGLHFEIRRNGKPVNPLRYLPSST